MTETTWIDALADDGLRDVDVQSIEIAFRVLARTRTTWPAPRDLIDALHAHTPTYFRALPAPILTAEQDATEREQRAAQMVSVREKLAATIERISGKRP